jgi:hypothetical protein
MRPFVNTSHGVWQLSKCGYTATATVEGDRIRGVVTNIRGEEVDSTVFAGRSSFSEVRWMLDTAIEAGE